MQSNAIHIAVLALFMLAAGSTALADPPPPSQQDRIAASRYPIQITDGRLAGEGAQVLGRSTQGAQYVLLGEDHGTAEIARFADALFGSLVPFGFKTAVVETGPLLATQLQSWISRPDGAREFTSFEARYPATTAFFGWSDEYAFLRHAYLATHGGLRVWGIDQELMGSSKFLLESALLTKPQKNSRALINALLAEDRTANARAFSTGNPNDTFMMSASRDKLVSLRSALRAEGNRAALRYVDGLIASYDIYVNCCNANAAQSNRDRAQLMKRNLATDLRASGGSAPKLFFKLGEEHLYRGFNPLRNNDVGNYVTELASEAGTSDIHILALGITGEQTVFAGMGHWSRVHYSLLDAQSRFQYLAPFVSAALPGGWTLYDLRPFRSHFDQMHIPDKNYERLVFGYDFLLLIPQTTADDPLDPHVF